MAAFILDLMKGLVNMAEITIAIAALIEYC